MNLGLLASGQLAGGQLAGGQLASGHLAGDFLRGRTIGRWLFRCYFNIVPNCIKCNVHKRTKSPLIPTQNF